MAQTHRRTALLSGAALVGGMLALVPAASAAASAGASSGLAVLAGSNVPFATASLDEGPAAAAQPLTVQVWLAPDEAGAEHYAAAATTPGSSSYHHWLSPDAYTARFGATAAEAHAVEAWLRSAGLAGVATDRGRAYVRASGTVATVDRALHVRIDDYRSSPAASAGRYQLRANDRSVTIPAALAGAVLGVTGLDNASPASMLIRPAAAATPLPTTTCSSWYGQRTVSGLPTQFGTTTFPTIICGYSAGQLRAAYGADSDNTGKGQTVALVELGLTRDMFVTLQDYARANGMPAPAAARYEQLSLGSDSCGDPFDGEEQLDVEASYDMAPGARTLVVGGDSCNSGDYGAQGLYDADIAVIDGDGGHPLATVASNSWETGDESQPVRQSDIEHAYLVRAADEGVGMYFSAGDGSGTLEPSIDPYAIAVGGTTLGIGQERSRLFETGWSTGASVIKDGRWALKGEDGASGGGASVRWAQPGYQAGVVPAALGKTRVAPDISASADPFTGMALGQLRFPSKGSPTYFQIPIGGTSESSPLVAGIVAATQQGQASPFGFLNPLIYRLAGSDAFFPTLPLTSKSPALYRGLACNIKIFANLCGRPPRMTLLTFDDQDPSMKYYTGQVTLPGYDDMTGLGSPDGQVFIDALRRLDH